MLTYCLFVAQSISPGKTWEGVGGGIALSVFTAFVFGKLQGGTGDLCIPGQDLGASYCMGIPAGYFVQAPIEHYLAIGVLIGVRMYL